MELFIIGSQSHNLIEAELLWLHCVPFAKLISFSEDECLVTKHIPIDLYSVARLIHQRIFRLAGSSRKCLDMEMLVQKSFSV